MRCIPNSKELQKHINHYWIVDNSSDLFSTNSKVFGYPGIRPEIILILKGSLKYTYLGKTYCTRKSLLASHINGSFLFDSSELEQFIIVQFKPRSIASLQAFTQYSSQQIMKNSLCYLEEVFEQANKLEMELKDRSSADITEILDSFFWKRLNSNYHGFLMELLSELPYDQGIKAALNKTGYSLSTLERYVKKETGLTPKGFLSLRKYKAALEEIHNNRENPDWQFLVEKYNYTDQSHFIKTIKKFTGFTPTQLLKVPNLISYRPLK